LATFDSSDKLKKATGAKQRRKKRRSRQKATSTRRFNWQKSPRFVAMRQQESWLGNWGKRVKAGKAEQAEVPVDIKETIVNGIDDNTCVDSSRCDSFSNLPAKEAKDF